MTSSWFQSDYISGYYFAQNNYGQGQDLSLSPRYPNPITGKHLYTDEHRRLFNGVVMLENGLYAGFETGNNGIPRFMTNADWDTPDISTGTRGNKWRYLRNQAILTQKYANP